MASNMKAKPSARLTRAKKRHGKAVTARLKEVERLKSRGSRGRGYSREDLEALRDGPA
jgi:hypothetical protein